MSNKTLNILILVQEFPEEFRAYLDKLGASIFMREDFDGSFNLTHIIVRNEEDAKLARNDYSTVKNEIKILSLSSVKDMKTYLLNNGRFTMDPMLVTTKIGEYLLNKFFADNHNIHLDESFGEYFQDFQKHEVINHLNIGEMIDEISLDAFDKGFNIVSLRSFLDHAIIYLTYLKQAGLSGIPFEIEYSSNDDFFAVNLHAPVKNFTAEYMIDAFGNVNSKDPLQYILGIVNRSTDFLDITYVENPSRVILTGFWNKTRKKFHGLSFNNILTTAQMMAQVERKIKEYQPVEEVELQVEIKKEALKPKSLPGSILEMVISKDDNSVLNKNPEATASLIAFAIDEFHEKYPDRSINDIDQSELQGILKDYADIDIVESLSPDDQEHLLDRIQKKNLTDAYDEELERVRANLEDEEDYIEDLSDTLNDEVASRVTGALDAETLNRVLNGSEDDNFSTNVSGGEEGEEFKVKISSTKENQEEYLVAKVSGSFESNLGEFNVKINNSSPEEKKNHLMGFINQSLDSVKQDASMDLKVRQFFSKNSPKKVSEGLEKFAQSKGIALEDISEKELLEFKDEVLPGIVSSILGDEEAIEDFAKRLDKKPTTEEDEYKSEFKDKFKARLEETLASIQSIEKDGNKFLVKEENMSEFEIQAAIKETMKQTFADEFKLDKANKKEIEEKEKEIVENLSITLNMPKEEVQKIVQGASQIAKDKETQTVLDNIFKSKPGDEEEVVAQEFQRNISEEKRDSSLDGSTQIGKDNNDISEEREYVDSVEIDGISGDKQIGKSGNSKIIEEERNKNANSENINQEQSEASSEIIEGSKEKENTENKPSNKTDKEDKQNASNSMVETQLLNKIKKMEEENKKLQKQLQAQNVVNGAKSESDKKVKEISEQVSQNIDLELSNSEDSKELAEIKRIEQSLADTEKIVGKAKSGQGLTNEEAIKLAQAIENEKILLQNAKKTEMEARKLALEAQQKDALFQSEINRANKALKAKDIVVEKTKESVQNLMSKKDKQLADYKAQIDNMNQRLNNDEATTLKTEVASLKSNLTSAEKMADMYKNKLDNLVKSKEAQNDKDNSEQLQAENRSLQRLKTQLENQFNSEQKQRKSLEDRYNKAKELEAKLRSKTMSAETNLKNAEMANKKLSDQATRLSKLLEQSKASTGADSKSQKEVDFLKKQIKQLQDNLSKSSGQDVNPEALKELENVKAQNKQLQDKLSKMSGQSINPEALKELEQVKAQNKELLDKIAKHSGVGVNPEALKELEQVKAQNKELLDKIAKNNGEGVNPETAKELENVKAQNKQLQDKISELNTKLTAPIHNKPDANAPSANEKRLEQSVKKLNTELSKAKSEVAENKKQLQKMKQEKVAINNKMQLLAKELEKAKKSSGKKAA